MLDDHRKHNQICEHNPKRTTSQSSVERVHFRMQPEVSPPPCRFTHPVLSHHHCSGVRFVGSSFRQFLLLPTGPGCSPPPPPFKQFPAVFAVLRCSQPRAVLLATRDPGDPKCKTLVPLTAEMIVNAARSCIHENTVKGRMDICERRPRSPSFAA